MSFVVSVAFQSLCAATQWHKNTMRDCDRRVRETGLVKLMTARDRKFDVAVSAVRGETSSI